MTITDLSIEPIEMDEEYVHYLESILARPIIQDNIRTTLVDPVVGQRWVGNLFGLLSKELSISENALYIHLRINDLKLNTDYDGRREIKILDPETFENVLNTYEINKAYRKSLGTR